MSNQLSPWLLRTSAMNANFTLHFHFCLYPVDFTVSCYLGDVVLNHGGLKEKTRAFGEKKKKSKRIFGRLFVLFCKETLKSSQLFSIAVNGSAGVRFSCFLNNRNLFITFATYHILYHKTDPY